jgi:hypothetical protein
MVKRVLRELKDEKGKVKQWQEENVNEGDPRAREHPHAVHSEHIQDESDAAKAVGTTDAELQSNKKTTTQNAGEVKGNKLKDEQAAEDKKKLASARFKQ